MAMALGVMFCYMGYNEYTVAANSFDEAVPVKLSDIERGLIPDSNHIRIGQHYRCYDASVYRYRLNGKDEQPTEYTKVTGIYYPVYSVDSPFGRRWRFLSKKYGGYDRIPDVIPEHEGLPTGNPSMIVHSRKFDTIGVLPMGIMRSEKMEGLLVQSIESLDSETQRLLQSGFGDVDFSKVLILSEDRKPTSSMVILALVGGGALLIIVAPVIGFAVQRRQDRTDNFKPPPILHKVRTPKLRRDKTASTSTDADSNPYRGAD